MSLGSGISPGEGIGYPLQYSQASLLAQLVNNLPTMRETRLQSLGWRRSPGEGKGYPLQYSDLENSMDYIVHGIAKSRTRLNNFHFFFKVLFLLEYSRLTMLCRFQVDSKGLSHTYICIHSSPNSPPIQATRNTEKRSMW